MFAHADFELLAGQMAGISGRSVLSVHATPGAREVFSRFAVDDVETTYMTASGGGKRVEESIVREGR